jgi:tellurium resistance protein TerD
MQNNGFAQPTPQPMQNNGYQQPMSNPQPMAQPMAQPMQQPMANPQPMQSAPMNSAPAFSNTPRPNGGGVVLAKGQKVSLSKMSSNLDLIEVGLGWDTATNSAIPYDLDAEAFMLGENGKVIGDDWFIFYNQPMSPDGSCKHSGDNKDGSGVGDDEVIQLQLSRVNPQVAKIAFVISINEAQARGHNFGGVQNAYVRVVDKGTGKELIKFNLTDYFKEVTSMTVGELYLKGGEWRFNAVGQGLNTDLAGLCGFYGVNLA